MLILSRKAGTKVFIDSGITVTVESFSDRSARITLHYAASNARRTCCVPLGQALNITGEAAVVPLRIIGNDLRIGFIAPAHIGIRRDNMKKDWPGQRRAVA